MNDEPPAIEGHISRAFDGELASLHLQVDVLQRVLGAVVQVQVPHDEFERVVFFGHD